MQTTWASLAAQWQRIRLPVQETRVQCPGQENHLEEEMAAHSSILAWEIPWTEEPGGLQLMGSQRVGHQRLNNNNVNSPQLTTLMERSRKPSQVEASLQRTSERMGTPGITASLEQCLQNTGHRNITEKGC